MGEADSAERRRGAGGEEELGAIEHIVVVNGEEQYSIWPAATTLPPGWSDAGFRGTRDACLEHVRGVWTDMRPRSLRRGQPRASDRPPP